MDLILGLAFVVRFVWHATKEWMDDLYFRTVLVDPFGIHGVIIIYLVPAMLH